MEFVKYVSAVYVCVSSLKQNLINFSVCLFLDVPADISPYFVTAPPFYSAEELGNEKKKNMMEKEQHFQVRKAHKFPSVH